MTDSLKALIKYGCFVGLVCTSATVKSNTHCLPIPNSHSDFGSLDITSLRTWIPNLRYIVNPEFLSIEKNDHDNYSLRHKFIPSDVGTDRVVAAINLESNKQYTVSQSVLFEDGFDWGGKFEGGKFGFGFGGGSAPSGGTKKNDGFTARLIWQGNNDGTAKLGVYLYKADANQSEQWGDVFTVEDYAIPVNKWVNIDLSISSNSSLNATDGSLMLLVDGENMLQLDNINWQSEGSEPTIDIGLYSTFFGGSSKDWSPENTSYIRFADICYTAS